MTESLGVKDESGPNCRPTGSPQFQFIALFQMKLLGHFVGQCRSET